MNDVRITQGLSPAVASRAVASVPSVEAKSSSVPASERQPLAKLQEATQVKAADEAKDSPKSESLGNVETAVAKVNEYVQSIERNLHFSVDKELDKTVVKVVDSSSGELIRQIPDEIFLELARRLSEDGELRLMNELS